MSVDFEDYFRRILEKLDELESRLIRIEEQVSRLG